MAVLQTFTKDAADEADYGIDWRKIGVLDADDALLATGGSAWTVPPAIESEKPAAYNATSGVTRVWVAGGVPGQKYTLTNTVYTVGGRTFERSIAVKIKEL